MLYCFLSGGAERAVGVDIAPTQKPADLYRLLHDYLVTVGAFRWWRPFAEDRSDPDIRYSKEACWDYVDSKSLLDRIEYLSPVTADELPFREGDFDLVYSCSAMEHFDRPAAVLSEIRRVLSPGGLTIHEIDLRSHAGAPLRHLTWTQEEYDRMAQKYDATHGIDKIFQGEWTTLVYCNRLLADDWRHAFCEAGLEILQLDVISFLEPSSIDPAQLAPPFCDRPQNALAPLIVRVVARAN
jgi:SAM-dependent methyltransferase